MVEFGKSTTMGSRQCAPGGLSVDSNASRSAPSQESKLEKHIMAGKLALMTLGMSATAKKRSAIYWQWSEHSSQELQKSCFLQLRNRFSQANTFARSTCCSALRTWLFASSSGSCARGQIFLRTWAMGTCQAVMGVKPEEDLR